MDELFDLWLDEGPTVAPSRIAVATSEAIRATNQRRATWWPVRRFPPVNATMKYGLAAVVVAGAALLGFTLLVAPNVGDEDDDATPTPVLSPAPTTAAILGTTNLNPGTYAIGDFYPVQFDLTIADEWETWGTTRDIVRIWKPCSDVGCTGYSAILDFEIVRSTLNPCKGDLPKESVGESVDELVNALTSLPGFEAGPVTDVSVDGQAGRAFELSFVGPVDASCDELPWQWLSNERVTWGPDAQQYVIVLEVNSTRLVVDAITYFGDRQEMDAIIDSIDFH